MKKVSVIGGGFSGLSASCYLAASGCEVTLFEKNEALGGRARAFSSAGFLFDMGPSWYWMPDVFESFFRDFGKLPSDYYKLVRLDPGFQIVFKDSVLQMPSKMASIEDLFEKTERGSAVKLRSFMADGARKYAIGMNDFVYRPSSSWREFAHPAILAQALRLQLFRPMRRHVASYFKDERLQMLMEFPVLFLGAMADKIPALYSLMSYAALQLGTWYPMGGMTEIVKSMESLAGSLGVSIRKECAVSSIEVSHGRAKALFTQHGSFATNGIIASADYHHIEQHLLQEEYRNYGATYWKNRVLAPSCMLFYLGISKKVDALLHHNLFFDAPFDQHAGDIYNKPAWPADPLFYVCCPSKTDTTVAPAGMENLFVLMPVAPGLHDSPEIRARYRDLLLARLERFAGPSIQKEIVFERSYCIRDFVNDYNAFKGNGYGLANTLLQTAFLKPAMKNHKIRNLFYAGQLTVPGPGVPPALISGKVAAGQLLKKLK